MRTFYKSVGALLAVVVLSVTLTNVLYPSSKARGYPVIEAAAIGSIGFADSDMWGYGPDDVNRAMDLMVDTGVQSVRILMPWAGVQPDPDTWNWGQVDLMVNAANSRGLGGARHPQLLTWLGGRARHAGVRGPADGR